ncbi:MAG TPA: DUF1634 domain-containing protein [Gemmatimonadales bacterium]|nr:DUF1634 domain-containing protein [Gemmatimonadales bacterium]
MTDTTETTGPARGARWSEHEVEQLIGNLLRIGVLIAAAVALAGGIAWLAGHGHLRPDYREFRGQPDELRSVTGVIGGALALHSAAIVQLGLLLLIATPIVRVAFSLVAFAVQRDRLYVVVTAIVLGVLLFGLLGGGKA